MKSALNRNQQENSAGNAAQEPQMSVRVSDNRLLAFLNVKDVPPGRTLTSQEVLGFLTKQGIVSGLREDEIRDFCSGGDYSRELLCAQGDPPVDEEDGELKYLFQTERIGLPAEREDGTVDYRDLAIVQNIKQGEALCRIVMPQQGKDGTDVFGRPIRCRKGKVPRFPTGHHTIASKDGLELLAAIDGCIEYRKDYVGINKTFVVHGNVDNSSGNIDFIGTVVVEGDVLGGFRVKAGGDITVRGVAEGATLEAGGSISISNGVNGLNGGKLTAGGDVKAKYIQNAVVSCGGNICTDVLMNSNVTAGRTILMRGPKASIMGGISRAGQQIYAKEIGTDKNIRTDVCVDSDEFRDALVGSHDGGRRVTELNCKVSEEKRSQQELRKKLEVVKQALASGKQTNGAAVLMKTLFQSIRDSEGKISEYEKQIREIQEKPAVTAADFNIVGAKAIYAGTKISLGDYNLLLSNNYSCSKFYIKESEVVFGPLLPSDRKDC